MIIIYQIDPEKSLGEMLNEVYGKEVTIERVEDVLTPNPSREGQGGGKWKKNMI